MSPAERDAADQILLSFLHAERQRVFEIVEGLDDSQLRTATLPSGWTPLGLIEHLGDAERHWFQEVALGFAAPQPWDDESEARPAQDVFAYYRRQIDRADEVLRTTPLDAAPRGRHSDTPGHEAADMREIVLHMIEETARHLGHLDAARELIDGRTGLGQDDY
jgi:uncharacterized damage-inducible protein DinB